jgi:hypothetical protein
MGRRSRNPNGHHSQYSNSRGETNQLYFFLGTFLPARRASDKPMAMACLRLFTFFPDLPLRSVPAFLSFIAFSTFLPLALLYLRAMIDLHAYCLSGTYFAVRRRLHGIGDCRSRLSVGA